jgi:DNA-directed RNA polymerase specialized sigma24 family protein
MDDTVRRILTVGRARRSVGRVTEAPRRVLTTPQTGGTIVKREEIDRLWKSHLDYIISGQGDRSASERIGKLLSEWARRFPYWRYGVLEEDFKQIAHEKVSQIMVVQPESGTGFRAGEGTSLKTYFRTALKNGCLDFVKKPGDPPPLGEEPTESDEAPGAADPPQSPEDATYEAELRQVARRVFLGLGPRHHRNILWYEYIPTGARVMNHGKRTPKEVADALRFVASDLIRVNARIVEWEETLEPQSRWENLTERTKRTYRTRSIQHYKEELIRAWESGEYKGDTDEF